MKNKSLFDKSRKENWCGIRSRPSIDFAAHFGRALGVLAATLPLYIFIVAPSFAQVTAPPNINGAYPLATNNLESTDFNTQTTGTLSGLGSNQGITFDFTGAVGGTANWNSGLSFLNADILQVQARSSGLSANPATYTIDFSDDVYGLQFTKGGLDNADETTISFFLDGVQVPVSVSTYVNGVETVSDPDNVITFAGTNIDIDGSAGSIRADGDGNNDTGGIGIHGAQEGFTINLPIDVAVDQVVFNSTGKNDGSSGNVTLIYTDFAWATPPELSVSKSPDVASVNDAGDTITYTISLTNTGFVNVTNISVADPLLSSLSCTPGAGAIPNDLAPAAVATCTGTYDATQNDFDTNGGGDGDIDNTVTVTADGAINETDSAEVALNVAVDLGISKIADDTTQVEAGQLITYTYAISNDGNQTISDVVVSDVHNGSGAAPTPTDETLTTDNPPFGDSVDSLNDGVWDSISPGDVVTFTATYVVTQSDIDNLQ